MWKWYLFSPGRQYLAVTRLIKVDPRWGWLSLIEMFMFLGILILGLVYVWVKGDLDWIKPKPITPTVDTRIPASLYEKLNKQQSVYKVKEFYHEMTVDAILQLPLLLQLTTRRL